MSNAECPINQQQPEQQPQQQQILNLQVVDAQRRGSTESAYYYTCSDLPPPDPSDNVDSRRGSSCFGPAGGGGQSEVETGQLHDVSSVAPPATSCASAVVAALGYSENVASTAAHTSAMDAQLPTLMEEIPEDSVPPPAGLTGRLNAIASFDFPLIPPGSGNDSLTLQHQSPTPRTTLPGRRFSLDASGARGGVGGGGSGGWGGGLFRLFHQESTPEQLQASLIGRRRRAANSRTTSDSETSLTAVIAVGPGSPNSPTAMGQNPSQLYRRFQSTDDDYFVALKVEEPAAQVFPVAQEREKLLCVTADGQTLTTEVSKPTPAATAPRSATNARRASTADCRAHRNEESEIEAALQLAKKSPFAYLPPRRLEPATNPTPATVDPQNRRRDLDWRRCVAEISQPSPAGSAPTARVKQLAAKFNAGCK